MGTAVDEIKALESIITWSPPQNGILLSSGAAGFMPGGVTFLDPNTGAPTTLLQVPVQAQAGTFDTTTLVIPPPPTPYTLTLDTTGGGSGSIGSFPAGASFPAGTIVGLTALPGAGSIFTGWSGACSGTGTCTVTMNSNESVTATFDLGQTYSGSFGAAFNGTFPDPLGDTYSASANGTIVLSLTQSGNGTISGSASVPTNIGISVASCLGGNICSAYPFSETAIGSVSGSAGSFNDTFTSPDRQFTITLTGTLNINGTITGSATFSANFLGTGGGTSITTTLSGSVPSITLTEQ